MILKKIRRRVRVLLSRQVITKEYIARFLNSHPVVIEAGAHVGRDTVAMSRLWPEGRIHAFEPVPELYRRLVENTRSCPNVRCYPLALNGAGGKTMMYKSSGGSDGSSSLLRPKEHLKDHPDVQFLEQLEVPTIVLDEWASANGIEQVDFLWLDLQGLELSVLQSSPRTIGQAKAVFAEVSFRESYEGVTLYEEFKEWMRRHSFEVNRLEALWADMGNALFVRTDVHT